MHIEQALPNEAATVAAVLNEAAQWLVTDGRPLWSASDVGLERVQRDTDAGRYVIAQENGEVVGVMRLDLEDPYFWPEIESGSSAFVHKLAVRRRWAGHGVSTALLDFARERALGLGRRHRPGCFRRPWRAPVRVLRARRVLQLPLTCCAAPVVRWNSP